MTSTRLLRSYVWPRPIVSVPIVKCTDVGAGLTVTWHVADLPLNVVAVMTALPSDTAVSWPLEATLTMSASEEV